MDDWTPDLTADWDKRHAWLVTTNGEIIIGPAGVVHDDVAVDALVDLDDVVAKGEIDPEGNVRQLVPLGNDFEDEVYEAWLEQQTVDSDVEKPGERWGKIANDWTPELGTIGRPWLIRDNILHVGEPDSHHDQWPGIEVGYTSPYSTNPEPLGKIWEEGRVVPNGIRRNKQVEAYSGYHTKWESVVESLWRKAVENGGSVPLDAVQEATGAVLGASRVGGTTLYHAAPRDRRELIQAEGLKPTGRYQGPVVRDPSYEDQWEPDANPNMLNVLRAKPPAGVNLMEDDAPDTDWYHEDYDDSAWRDSGQPRLYFFQSPDDAQRFGDAYRVDGHSTVDVWSVRMPTDMPLKLDPKPYSLFTPTTQPLYSEVPIGPEHIALYTPSHVASGDWAPNYDDPWKYRRAWWVNMADPNNPTPPMWLGQPGENHPYPIPVSDTDRWRTIKGVIDERTNPPVFNHFYEPTHPAYPLAETALKHAERAYYQSEDKPEQRQVEAMGLRGDLPTDFRTQATVEGVAAFAGNQQIGTLLIEYGRISNIEVLSEYQRQGVATAMLNAYEEYTGEQVIHNWENMSNEGEQWARAVDPDAAEDEDEWRKLQGISSKCHYCKSGYLYDQADGSSWCGACGNTFHKPEQGQEKTARQPQLHDGKLWGNIVFLLHPQAQQVIVGRPTDHHPDAYERATGLDSFGVRNEGGGWLASPEFKEWEQWDLNFELEPSTGEVSIYWPYGVFPQKEQIEQQARENISHWIEQNGRSAFSKTADADHWHEPQGDQHFEGINMDNDPMREDKFVKPCYCDCGPSPHEWMGSCENGKRPTMKHEASTPEETYRNPRWWTAEAEAGRWWCPQCGEGPWPSSGALDLHEQSAHGTTPRATLSNHVLDHEDNWVYLDGKIAFGGEHHDIARALALKSGYEPTAVSLISNMVARNSLPAGHEVKQGIALGTLKGGYPQIWLSTIDRNHVWDEVTRHLQDGTPKTSKVMRKMRKRAEAINGDVTASAVEISVEDHVNELEYSAFVDGKQVGVFDLFKHADGKFYVIDIRVAKGYQRQGIATALFKRAQEDLGAENVIHSSELTDAGRAWRRSLGKVSSVPQDQMVYIAEGAMERGGFTGGEWRTPKGHIDEDSEIRASMDAMSQFVREATGLEHARVIVSDYDTTTKGIRASAHWPTQTVYVSRKTTDLELLHESAHLLRQSNEGEGHDQRYCEIARDLYTQHLGAEAGEIFWNLVGPRFAQAKTAMGERGDLPGIEVRPAAPPSEYDYGLQSVEAVLDGQVIGKLSWSEEAIHDVWVVESYRRMGVASAMKAEAEKMVGHTLQHSDDLSSDAQAWAEKTAAATVMYHVAWQDDVEKIMQSGLRPGDPGGGDDNPSGTYLFDTPEQAQALATERAEGTLSDDPTILQVNVTGLSLDVDPTWGRGSYYTQEPIGPERLSLIK